MIEKITHNIGDYKTLKATCTVRKYDYLELTKYPDGDTLISVRTKGEESDNDPCVFISEEDLNKLMEELK
ncbi:hypothetical protein [Enterococcus phage vB_EfaS_Ef6.4]|nr:hypothetical protein [Enterococcus phage vB_EfaS_Ef6.4]